MLEIQDAQKSPSGHHRIGLYLRN